MGRRNWIRNNDEKNSIGVIEMRYETLTWVNQQAEKARKEKEDKKLKNRIKRLFNKKTAKAAALWSELEINWCFIKLIVNIAVGLDKILILGQLS